MPQHRQRQAPHMATHQMAHMQQQITCQSANKSKPLNEARPGQDCGGFFYS